MGKIIDGSNLSSDDESTAEKERQNQLRKDKVFISCISLLLSTAVIMFTIFSFTGKLVETARAKYTTQHMLYSNGDVTDNIIDSQTELYSDVSDIAQTEASTATEKDGTVPNDTSSPLPAAVVASAVEHKPTTVSEIVAYYNKSANAVKSGSKSVLQNYQRNSPVGTLDVNGNRMLSKIGTSLMNRFLGDDKNRSNKLYSTYDEKKTGFTVENETWTSKLTADDIQNATCTELNGIYTITILLKPDTTPIEKAGDGHAGKGVTILTKSQIEDGGSSVPGGISNIAMTYSNCKIAVKIQKTSGKMIYGNYYTQVNLALRALGTDCSLGMSFDSDYTIKW
jgi:hypothetical protein